MSLPPALSALVVFFLSSLWAGSLAAQLAVSLVVTNASCQGSSDGRIVAVVTGSTGAVSYSWNTGATTALLDNLGAGTYSVTVTDATDSSVSASATVGQPPAIQVFSSVTDVDCSGTASGAIDLTISGGTAPYSFTWSNGALTEDLTNLSGGTYANTVTDANGCTAVTILTVDEPSAIGVVAEVTDMPCADAATGAIDLTVSGGVPPYTFFWSNEATTEDQTGLPAGDYTVEVTDALGCSATAMLSITAPPPLEIEVSQQDLLCQGAATGTLQTTVTGGTPPYSYAWSNGATTAALANLPAGSYSGTVTDANGCTVTATATIRQPPAVSVLAAVTDADCSGAATGAIDLTISGGTAPFSFSWSNGATTEDLSGLIAGTYTGVIVDANGCIASTTVTVSEPLAIDLAAAVTAVDCHGAATGSIDLMVSGGTAPYTFAWSNSSMSEDLSDLVAGTYTVTVTDAAGCVASTPVLVSEPPPISMAGEVTPTNCDGAATGAIDLVVSGGTGPYSFGWSNGAPTEDLSGLPTGSYTATVLDASGCIASATFEVGDAAAMALTTESAATCSDSADGSVLAAATGGAPPYTYLWSTGAGTATVSDLVAGNYAVTVTDTNGCTATATVNVAGLPTPTCTLEIVAESTTGDNGALRVIASGGTAPFSYSWSNGRTTDTVASLAPGTYSVTVTDANGCTTSCLTTLSAYAGIGDYVWNDVNRNGQQDVDEPPVSGIPVELQDTLGNVLAATVTDASGNYLFGGLAPGTYRLHFIIPDTFIYTVPNVGNEATDSDLEPGANGMTTAVFLAPGEIDRSVDVGLLDRPNATISTPCSCLNNATNDANGQFLEVLTVRSYPGETWTIVANANMFRPDSPAPPAAPLPVSPGTALTEVTPGIYQIEYILVDSLAYSSTVTNGTITLATANQCFYPQVAFTLAPPDTLCVFDAPFTPTAAGSVPGEVVFTVDGTPIDVLSPELLGAGTYAVVATLLPTASGECLATASTELTIVDACPAEIGDFVWLDENFDGRQDSSEPGIAGVSVTLFRAAGNYTETTTTDANGRYRFSVDPGTYQLTFEAPPDLSPTRANVGTDDTVDSDLDPITSRIDSITVGPRMANLGVDAGFRFACANVLEPGTIGYNQYLCGPGNDPDPFVDVTSPVGGFGELEYQWLSTTGDPSVPIDFWTPVPESNSPSYDPGPIDTTTYFVRCVRRAACDEYLKSNVVEVTVGNQALARITAPAIVCEGQAVTFSSATASEGEWTFAGPVTPNEVSGASATVTYQDFGTFAVTFEVAANNCRSTDVVEIAVRNNPTTCDGALRITAEVTDPAVGVVRISWEQDEDGLATTYTVERSIEGTDFAAVGTLSAPTSLLGTTGVYEFADRPPKRGRNFYRVRAMDVLGNELLSNTVAVSTENRNIPAKLFPNPAREGTVFIELYDVPKDAAQLTIVNTTGQVLRQFRWADPGQPQPIDVRGLPRGLYFVDLLLDGEPAGVLKMLID
jgi:hypothetical protein